MHTLQLESNTPTELNAPVAASRSATRLVALDVLRGITVAGMVLVTDPGTYSAVYPPLRHAAWSGATPTDFIFPDFLFSAGVALVLSLHLRLRQGVSIRALALRALRRSLLLLLIGLAVNGFPDYHLSIMRLPGILQRIALCYAGAALLYLGLLRWGAIHTANYRLEAGRRLRCLSIAGVIVAILAGYWALLRYFPVPGFGPARYDSLGNLGAYIDRAVFTTQHLWAYGLTPGYGVTYDSEGLLSTLPAITNTLIGILAGEWLLTTRTPRRKALAMAIVGLALFIVGWLLDPLMPINKRIWTSTFALLSSGASLCALALVYWLVDIRRSRWWTTPALIFGTNAILAFVLSTIITTLTDRIHLHTSGSLLTLHQAGYAWLSSARWLAPRNASLAYALVIVLLNTALLYPLYRKRIFLRV